MAGSLIERALGLLELLASDARGLPLQQLADRLDIPKSAAHRMLAELIRLGYVRQDDDTSRYRLSTRLAALGFRFLASSGVVDLVQPVLDGLARETGELVRLGVIEGDRQTWIAKSQGATSGLRYDPDMGREAPLFYTASGHAWLASLSDKAALALVERQGVGAARDFQRAALQERAAALPEARPRARLCLADRMLGAGHGGDGRTGAPLRGRTGSRRAQRGRAERTLRRGAHARTGAPAPGRGAGPVPRQPGVRAVPLSHPARPQSFPDISVRIANAFLPVTSPHAAGLSALPWMRRR